MVEILSSLALLDFVIFGLKPIEPVKCSTLNPPHMYNTLSIAKHIEVLKGEKIENQVKS